MIRLGRVIRLLARLTDVLTRRIKQRPNFVPPDLYLDKLPFS